VSAPALRRPARWRDAVRAELVVLREAHAYRWAWLAVWMAVLAAGIDRPGDGRPFEDVRLLVGCMFFFPLAWQGDGASRRRNAPRPLDDLTAELIRLACGAACAAVVLGLCIAAYSVTLEKWSILGRLTADGTVGGLPAWYPFAQFLLGMAHYLFGAAVMLPASRPGRTLSVVFGVAMLAVAASGIGLETTERSIVSNGDGAGRWTESTSLTLGAAVLRLAVACVALALAIAAVHARRKLPVAFTGLPWLRRLSYSPRAHPRPVMLRSPRAPASSFRVVVRQFRVLAPRVRWPLLIMAGLTWLTMRNGVAYEVRGVRTLDAGYLEFLAIMAYLWPVLVWRDERGNLPWDEARPVDTVPRRLLHAAAGLVWLQAAGCVGIAVFAARAVEDGVLASLAAPPAWLWAGVPAALLATYCLGTIAAVLSDRPLLASFVQMWLLLIVVALLSIRLDPELREPPLLAELLGPVGLGSPRDWSPVGAMPWILLFVAAAISAIEWRTRRDRAEHRAPVQDPAHVVPNLWYGRRTARRA
jgi:hypothetical protein